MHFIAVVLGLILIFANDTGSPIQMLLSLKAVWVNQKLILFATNFTKKECKSHTHKVEYDALYNSL